MARTIERRRTTTRRSNSQDADHLKRNISNVAEEIAKVRDQAREEVSALEKIRGMLDVGYLNDLLESIEQLEVRIEELENDSLQSREDVDRYQKELEQEQDRLAKLWDAYKTQEDELQRVKRDYPLMEEKLFERERTIDHLKREQERLEKMESYKADYEKAAQENRRLNEELDRLDAETEKFQSELARLEEENRELESLKADSGRTEELERQLDEERERLAKLYKVYEDQQEEHKDMEKELGRWEAWFRKIRPTLESVEDAVHTAPVE